MSQHRWSRLFSVGVRALAEHPVLDTSPLNEAMPGVGEPGETIQVRADHDLAVNQLWQLLPCPLQLSLPYVTSAVHLDRG